MMVHFRLCLCYGGRCSIRAATCESKGVRYRGGPVRRRGDGVVCWGHCYDQFVLFHGQVEAERRDAKDDIQVKAPLVGVTGLRAPPPIKYPPAYNSELIALPLLFRPLPMFPPPTPVTPPCPVPEGPAPLVPLIPSTLAMLEILIEPELPNIVLPFRRSPLPGGIWEVA